MWWPVGWQRRLAGGSDGFVSFPPGGGRDSPTPLNRGLPSAGMDVTRKVINLARECGNKIELSAVNTGGRTCWSLVAARSWPAGPRIHSSARLHLSYIARQHFSLPHLCAHSPPRLPPRPQRAWCPSRCARRSRPRSSWTACTRCAAAAVLWFPVCPGAVPACAGLLLLCLGTVG